jgi:hypothetical protein
MEQQHRQRLNEARDGLGFSVGFMGAPSLLAGGFFNAAMTAAGPGRGGLSPFA